ncbi:MAG: GTP cyclohydrolase I FolE [Candidatus Marinimicrobia bacterium]|nr:GTP cyclohydrolase I FolE [Candidatus Neomarinimicrobiota bacterium]
MNANAKPKLERLTYQLLSNIGENPNREGLIRTPERVALAWEHLAGGYDLNLEDIVGDACFEEDYNEMVTVKDIDFFSMCEHHLLPFFGKAHVGYLPKGRVIGLSKIPRIVEMYARRLQVQERMTLEIGNALMDVLKPMGVAVVVEGTHMCMQMRGVEKQNSYVTTSHMVGAFETNQKTREEFFSIIALGRR